MVTVSTFYKQLMRGYVLVAQSPLTRSAPTVSQFTVLDVFPIVIFFHDVWYLQWKMHPGRALPRGDHWASFYEILEQYWKTVHIALNGPPGWELVKVGNPTWKHTCYRNSKGASDWTDLSMTDPATKTDKRIIHFAIENAFPVHNRTTSWHLIPI